MGIQAAASAFGYRNVRLKESPFKTQFDQTARYLLDVPDDSLLYGFRRRAGRPTPGSELFGWYGHGVFHVFGQLLGALAKMYRASGDKALLEKAVRLTEGWAQCIEKDGYCYYNPRGKVNDLHYEYEKLLGGLLDMAEYAGYPEALRHVSTITDWAIKNLNRDITRQFRHPAAVNFIYYREWYTLSENLYRAHEVLRDEKYRQFAECWEYPDYWNKFLDPGSAMDACHAYSHVNTLCGAARAYRVKGDRKYLATIEGAYQRIYPEHVYATGGYGPGEGLFGQPGYLSRMLLKQPENGMGNAEIPCGAWAVFKLSNYLMEFTGRAAYGSWAERMLYNGIGAELPMHPEGRVMYYANYQVDGAQKAVEFEMTALNTTGTALEWPCCSGTYPQAVAEYYNLISYRTPEGLDICQYVPAVIRWDDALAFDIDTAYPNEEEIRLTAMASSAIPCTLRLRVPEWATGPVALEVNGNPVPVAATPNDWLEVKREWRNADRVTLRLPLRLRFEAVDRSKPDIAALCYGPLVLAANRPGVFQADILHPELWIERTGGALAFQSAPGAVKGYPQMTKRFRPFAEYALGERYYLYNKVERTLSWT